MLPPRCRLRPSPLQRKHHPHRLRLPLLHLEEQHRSSSTLIQVPLFSSMVTKGSFHTAGCWSPSRAGVCFIGKSNGTIDIWDFMDQSHKWTMQYSVGSIGISSMKFHEQCQNILAVGSQEGTLHILELPFTLVRKVGDEDKTMNEYW